MEIKKSFEKSNGKILDIKISFQKSNGRILEIKKSFARSNGQIVEIEKSRKKSKGQILQIKNHFRNQTDKFWKSKKSCQKSETVKESKQIIILGILLEHRRYGHIYISYIYHITER